MCNERTSDNERKGLKGKFLWDTRKKTFSIRLDKYWNRLLRVVMDLPSLETQAQMDIELSSETQVTLKRALFEKGFGWTDLQRLDLPQAQLVYNLTILYFMPYFNTVQIVPVNFCTREWTLTLFNSSTDGAFLLQKLDLVCLKSVIFFPSLLWLFTMSYIWHYIHINRIYLHQQAFVGNRKRFVHY